ncbi:unnamed protein product [Didymodactylos carnosus]|uniref:Peptidase S1 domain-containing protein n=1 Tax=Didymodactylos carnosus TaxID=1234261 RepID=A0A813XCM3_9BILA|nr:unnamed protein product [Didymodactylos carnosus]CAF0862919.1 unnamed protein product [Didymodactylos carnosus]CAF3505630.1 unnamed protein product [Didymodactylos carnosus]CAF3650487.1 unnamed protein product [Didymodactylos carnosus]
MIPKQMTITNDCIPSSTTCGCSKVAPIFSRIVGGYTARAHSWPWIVSIRESVSSSLASPGAAICGGVLITNKHILTAAHCFYGVSESQYSKFFFVVGATYINDTNNVRLTAKSIRLHEYYDDTSKLNDIAIIELRSAVDFNDSNIGSICLPIHVQNPAGYPSADMLTVAIGWGTLTEKGSVSYTLQQVELPVVASTSRYCYNQTTDNDSQFCAGFISGGKDTCQGDSGGPLMILINTTWFVVGVTSYGNGCGRARYPGVYTRVSWYMDWINAALNASHHIYCYNNRPSETFYQQQQPSNNRWYYSNRNDDIRAKWYWTPNDVPSSNFYKNIPENGDQLSSIFCGRSKTSIRFSRIMGGQDAVPHSYPWMVSLAKRSINNQHLCGGVLITRQHVITAAHCIEDFSGVDDLSIFAGIHFAVGNRNPYQARQLTVHPNYDSETFANDIAIITLRTPVPDNDERIGVICLPQDDAGKSYPSAKTSSVAIGWGSTSFGGKPSLSLKQVALPILESNKWPCNGYLTFPSGQICAGELSGGADTCQADSGGPLMIENNDLRWEIVGITSFGKSCGKPNTPGTTVTQRSITADVICELE